jgi:hypothetical protein
LSGEFVAASDWAAEENPVTNVPPNKAANKQLGRVMFW